MRTAGLFFAMLFLFTATLLVSCGDDSIVITDDNQNLTGDPNDPAFQQMQDATDIITSVTEGLLDMGTGKRDGVDEDDFDGFSGGFAKLAVPGADSLSLVYTSNGWWVADFSISQSEQGFSLSLSMSDSSQFRDLSGEVQAIPDETTDYLRNNAHFSMAVSEGSNLYLDFGADYGLIFTDLSSQLMTVDGYMSVYGSISALDSLDHLTSGSFTYDISLDNVKIPVDEQNACLQSGTITGDITENYSEGFEAGSNGKSSWHIVIEIQNDGAAYAVTISSGNTIWEQYTIDSNCSEGFTLQGLFNMVGLVNDNIPAQ